MDALNLLKEDHDRVNQLFKQSESADDKRKLQLFDEIRRELELHTRLEENIFYPACQRLDGLRQQVLEAIEEHRQVTTLLKEIDRARDMNDRIEAKLTVLQENVQHHVQEEEGRLFPEVRKRMDSQQLDELGQQLMDAKGRARVGRQAR